MLIAAAIVLVAGIGIGPRRGIKHLHEVQFKQDWEKGNPSEPRRRSGGGDLQRQAWHWALTHLGEGSSLPSGKAIADEYGPTNAGDGIADAKRGTGDHDRVLGHYQQALRLARQIGEPYEEGAILNGIAETILRTRGPRDARIHWRQALDIFERVFVTHVHGSTPRAAHGSWPPGEGSAGGGWVV